MKIFKVLRMLRVLRPLRVISRNEGLKLAVQTLIKAIPNLLNLIVVLLIFYLLFAIFCVSLLKGRFYHCDSSHIKFKQEEILTKHDCLNAGGVWSNKLKNFDNVFNGMKTLFEISTASWVETMWDCVDQRGIDLEPKKYNNLAWVLFMISLVVFFMFFLINLFVGVVVTTFNQEKERLGKDFLLTNK